MGIAIPMWGSSFVHLKSAGKGGGVGGMWLTNPVGWAQKDEFLNRL